ncbi:MAG: CHAT domain-containing protein, partial [Desulfobulbaceae bacterium]|nr:CHAT domain-containing protein [Desulfobulbaceae bacterium]
MRHSFLVVLMVIGGLLQVSCLGSSGVSSGITAVNYVAGRSILSVKDEVGSDDLADLKAGKIYDLREKYEKVGVENLSNARLQLLCDLYSSVNDFDATMECLARVEDRAKTDEGLLLTVLGRRALVYLKTGQYRKASQLSRSLDSDGGQYIHALASVGIGEPKTARRLALKFSRFEDSSRKQYFATAIYMALGEYDKALEILVDPRTRLLRDFGLLPHTNSFGQTISPAVFRLDLFGEFNFGIGGAFSFAPKANVYVEFMAARAFSATGDKGEAMTRFSYLIDSIGAGTFRDILWMSYFERGRLFEQDGEVAAAIDDYRHAISLIEGIRSTIRSEMGRVGFAGDKFKVYNQLIKVLVGAGQNQEALAVVERFKGRALVDMLSARSSFGVAATDPVDAPRLLQNLADAEARVVSAPVALSAKELAGRLASLEKARAELAHEAPALSSLVAVKPVSFDALRQTVGADESVLVFHQDGETLYTFALNHQGVSVVTTPVADLVQQVSSFREAIADYKSDDYRRHARLLYDRLLAPVSTSLATNRLTVVPAGVLYYLPFAALLDQNDQFVAQRVTLRVLPSLSVIPLLNQGNSDSTRFLVYGNPDRGDVAMDLPGAEVEAESVAKLSANSTLCLKKDASAVRFRSTAADYGYIHIASHGEFRSDDPLESRLLLAPSGNDSGDLKVNDLYGLHLSAQLV